MPFYVVVPYEVNAVVLTASLLGWFLCFLAPVSLVFCSVLLSLSVCPPVVLSVLAVYQKTTEAFRQPAPVVCSHF